MTEIINRWYGVEEDSFIFFVTSSFYPVTVSVGLEGEIVWISPCFIYWLNNTIKNF